MSTANASEVGELLTTQILGKLVDQTIASWNLVSLWLRRLDDLKARTSRSHRLVLLLRQLSELGQHLVQALKGVGARPVPRPSGV